MSNKKRKLGSWFPTASLIKSQKINDDEAKAISILLFYQYVTPKWSAIKTKEAINFLETIAIQLNLGGRLRVAEEGINATITGTFNSTRNFINELKNFDNNFNQTDFKFIDNMPLDRHFKDMKVLPVKELVYYGINNEYNNNNLDTNCGTHLSPKEFHEKLASNNNDTVVLDVRNAYESEIGRFGGQEAQGGANLIRIPMRKSTDFPKWLNDNETKKTLENKKILMYCTGGVRCERASALLAQEMGNKVQEICQLEGGIEKYLQTYDVDGGFWQGQNFVFDKREACDYKNPAGVGGVIVKKDKDKNKNKKNKNNNSNDKKDVEVLSNCVACNSPFDRYLGKKKCYYCQVPVILCENCLSKKVDKDAPQLLKCYLCKIENNVIAAGDILITDNGINSSYNNNNSSSSSSRDGVASTVCKWGGGHSKKKMKQQ